MKKTSVFMIFLLIPFYLFSSEEKPKKVLFVNSYHKGYVWSDGIEKGIFNIKNKSTLNIELKSIEMDSKNNTSIIFKKEAALKVKKILELFKPDVVIACDDNASKYLILPYYSKSNLPFIFCGLNADPKEYNFPSKNVTGMREVELIKESIHFIKQYTKGSTLGHLGADNISERKIAARIEELTGQKTKKHFVSSVKEWKKHYLLLQKSVDIVSLSTFSPYTLKKEIRNELSSFVKNNTLLPSISWSSTSSDFSLLTFAKIPEEQGEWAMKTAIRLLKGEKIKDIPVSRNKKAKIYVNLSLMKTLNIVLPFEILENAVIKE